MITVPMKASAPASSGSRALLERWSDRMNVQLVPARGLGTDAMRAKGIGNRGAMPMTCGYTLPEGRASSKAFQAAFASALFFIGCASGGSGVEDWGLNERREPISSETAEEIRTSEHEFAAVVPVGVERSRVTLSARQVVTLGDKVDLVESDQSRLTTIAGLGGVQLGESSQVGSIYGGASSSVVVGSGASVHGYIKAEGTVRVAEDAKVAIGTMEGIPVGGEQYRWPVYFAVEAEPPLKGQPSEMLDLTPGAYEALSLGETSTAVLHKGHYEFGSLTVDAGAMLQIDNSRGPVYIWIADSFALRGVILHDSVVPRVFFGYSGTATPEITSAFRGTLVAPRARIELPNAEAPHVGAVFADTIAISSGARIVHAAFVPFASDDYDPALDGAGLSAWIVP